MTRRRRRQGGALTLGLSAALGIAVAASTRAAPGVDGAVSDRDAIAVDVDTLEAQLSGIDFLPDRARIDGVVAGNAVNELVDMINDTEAAAGRRLRALRTLGAYDTDSARKALVGAVERYRDAESGLELVYLRAAVEALASVGDSDTAIIIGDLLEHPSPDVRAAAARGLGDLNDPAGTAFLFRQLDIEKVPFVRAAIERALSDLL